MLTVCAQRGERERREVIGGLVQTPPLGIKTSSREMTAFHDNGASPFSSRLLFFYLVCCEVAAQHTSSIILKTWRKKKG